MNNNVTNYGGYTTYGTANTVSGTSWTIDDKYLEYTTPYYPPPIGRWGIITGIDEYEENNNKKGGDDMRYLYEVILVNPKSDTFYVDRVVARSETSALMEIYNDSPFNEKCESGIVCDEIKFDDLKTSCRVLMSWTKEKSLEKALETIKKAVE